MIRYVRGNFIKLSEKSKRSVACAFCKTHKLTTAFFETMTEVHEERKDFEKMKKEDLMSECLKLNKYYYN